MSSQRGNSQRNRSQKYTNSCAFKNNMHDTSKQTSNINKLEMHGLCSRCKGILEWKVKYKKYKPLTQPGLCVKCGQRNVKRAYFTICQNCLHNLKICGKCGQDNEIVIPVPDSNQQIFSQFENNLRNMRERERRTIFRLMQSGNDGSHNRVATKPEKDAHYDAGVDGKDAEDQCLASHEL